MKDFFENFGKRFGETAEMVTNKAGEMIEIQRVESQIDVYKRQVYYNKKILVKESG